MARRSKEWDKTLQKELKNAQFAKNYIDAIIKEGIPIQVALGQVVRAMGVTEYAKKMGIQSQNLHRLLNSESNPTLETLNLLLKPLNLAVGIIQLDDREIA